MKIKFWTKKAKNTFCSHYQKAVENNAETFGYEWTRKDGKIVELRDTVKGGEE